MCLQVTLIGLCLLGAAVAEGGGGKRAPSGFMGMRGKKQDVGELVYDDLDKRSPGMGFQGMRGKKDQEGDSLQQQFEPEFYEKRAPGAGFQGVRGKKDNDFNFFSEEKKGGPGSGFQGMRGKKDQDLLQTSDFYDKRAPGSGFQGVRGKKDVLDDGIKRAPSLGFQGVRGKKDPDFQFDPNPEYFNDDRYMWPVGMGDKDDNDYTSLGEDIWGEGFEKRAPSGFLGMRGKKQPASGFFGMRGKKAPSGFLGMRGKKVPSGFMGMRGKKSGEDLNLETLLESLEAAPPGATVRQKRYKSQVNIKKAPSGFLGMRGKKWLESEMEEARGAQVGNTL